MRRRRVLSLAAIVAALALVGGAIGGYIWLDRYAPLGLGGSYGTGYQKSGLRAYVQAVPGSEGKDVVFPKFRRGRDYFVGTTIWNEGRFDVTLLGVATERFPRGTAGMYPRDLRAVRQPDPVEGVPGLRDTSPTSHLLIRAHQERFVWVGFG